MNKLKYLKISNIRKIRYLSNNFKNNLYIVFLHGFMSDIEGEKPKTILKYAKKNKLSFLALEFYLWFVILVVFSRNLRVLFLS